MAIETARLSAVALATLIISGCATSGSGAHTAKLENWGEANRQTMAAQIIDPNPQYDTAMATSGAQVAGAITRLRTDSVKKPERTQTSSSGTNSSTR